MGRTRSKLLASADAHGCDRKSSCSCNVSDVLSPSSIVNGCCDVCAGKRTKIGGAQKNLSGEVLTHALMAVMARTLRSRQTRTDRLKAQPQTERRDQEMKFRYNKKSCSISLPYQCLYASTPPTARGRSGRPFLVDGSLPNPPNPSGIRSFGRERR